MFSRNCNDGLAEKAAVCVACDSQPKAGNKYCYNCANVTSALATLCTKRSSSFSSIADTTVFNGKNRLTYSPWAFFFVLIGLPGIHNLYPGYIGKGLAQLLIAVLSCWILWVPMK